MKRLLMLALTMSAPCALLYAQTLIRVPQDQPTVQAGINAAVNGDTVLVAEGTYSVNLVLTKKIVLGSLYIIDDSTSHISKTILDGGTPSHPDSGSVLLILDGTDSTTVISGFTIQNGSGTKASWGGISYIVGGGISIIGGGATVTHNVIANNDCVTTTLGCGAAGIDVEPNAANTLGPKPWVIANNVIANNSSNSTAPSTSTTGFSDGGGLGLGGQGRLMNNIIRNNSAAGTKYGAGAGVAIYGLPGPADILISGNLIMSNTASSEGGGIAMWVNMPYRPNVHFQNNIISGNTAGVKGAAMFAFSGDYSLVNNTIATNGGTNAFALFESISGENRGALNFRLLNNIIWNPGSTNEFNSVVYAAGSYNDVRGGLTGTGNINNDPLFISTHPDSLAWFQYYSPCRDAGVASATVGGTLLTAPTVDYYGHPRSGTPDIGAFEAGIWSSVEDVSLGVPADFMLEQNFPNPFNPSTVIRFALPKEADVQIDIYNILGQKVEELVNQRLSAGFKQVTWTANVPSGVYLYRITVSTVGGQRYEEAKRMVLVR